MVKGVEQANRLLPPGLLCYSAEQVRAFWEANQKLDTVQAEKGATALGWEKLRKFLRDEGFKGSEAHRGHAIPDSLM